MSVFSLEKFKHFLHNILYLSENLKLQIFIKTKEQGFKHFFISSIRHHRISYFRDVKGQYILV